MDAEAENVRVAWEWAVERPPAAQQIAFLDRAIFALWRYADFRGQRQAYASRFDKAVQALSAAVAQETTCEGSWPEPGRPSDGEGTRVLSKLLAAQSFCSASQGSKIRLARQSLALLERPELRERDVRAEKALALLAMGMSWQANWALEQSLALYRELDDRWGTAFVLVSLGHAIPSSPPNYDRLWCLSQEALSLSQARGNLITAAYASHGQAQLTLQQGQLEQAERLGR
jgi:hypothetical protein